MSSFDANMEVLERRWPGVATALRAFEGAPLVWRTNTPDRTLMFSGIHLTSAYDRRAEAALQAELVPEASGEATVYGVALGDLPRVLLARATLASLRVMVMSPAVAASSMAAVDHVDWLSDSRVSLSLVDPDTSVSFPFAVAPAMLRLASDAALPLRDRLVQVLARPFQEQYFRSLDAVLDERVGLNRRCVAADGDVASLFGTAVGARIAVVAAGPTAASQFERLRAHRRALKVIVVSTALRPLLRGGVCPDAVVVIDPKLEIRDHFAGMEPSSLSAVPLIYLPTVHPEVIAGWPGPRLVTYIPRARFAALAETLPRGLLQCDGTVTHVAVDLAVQMGAREIVLVGADFSFPGNQTHVEGAAHGAPVIASAAHPMVINGHGGRNPSRADMISFLRDLERFIAAHPEVVFFNTGKAGARIAGAGWLEEQGWNSA